jgi:HlyD family secretion protein
MSETVTAPQSNSVPQQPEPPRAAEPGRTWKLGLIVMVLLTAAAVVVWRLFFFGPGLPNNIVALSGRIEGDDSAIAPKTGGRILEVRFREGDSVAAGEIIARLSDEQIVARDDQARAGVSVAEAAHKSAQDQIAVLQEQLRQNQIQTAQSKVDAEGRVNQAQAELAAAEADLAQQQAAYQLASFDQDAYTRLAQTGAASERQAKQAVATAGQQAAAVAAAQRRVTASKGALTAARANLDNPTWRQAQTAMIERQIVAQRTEIVRADASLRQSEGQLLEAEANRRDLTVRAPFSGVIATRAAEPGEVVNAGTALVTLIDLSKVYLRGFIPEGQIGNVKLRQAARVYLDSNPNQPIDAYVSRVDPQATFTPENTYFRDERVKQVVGVKLQLKNGFGYAKPGMPADGEILTQGDAWPARRRNR